MNTRTQEAESDAPPDAAIMSRANFSRLQYKQKMSFFKLALHDQNLHKG